MADEVKEPHAGGRPPLFATPEEFEEKVNEYFEYIKGEGREQEETVFNKRTQEEITRMVMVWDREPEPPTVTGLALFLGFTDRQSLYDYQEKPKFSCIVKKARTRVEHGYEKSLSSGTPTGAIFALKNMGWRDRTETDITTKGDSINKESDLSSLTKEELQIMAAIQKKINGA